MVNNLNTGETNMETNLFFRQAVDDTKTVYLNLGGGGYLNRHIQKVSTLD